MLIYTRRPNATTAFSTRIHSSASITYGQKLACNTIKRISVSTSYNNNTANWESRHPQSETATLRPNRWPFCSSIPSLVLLFFRHVPKVCNLGITSHRRNTKNLFPLSRCLVLPLAWTKRTPLLCRTCNAPRAGTDNKSVKRALYLCVPSSFGPITPVVKRDSLWNLVSLWRGPREIVVHLAARWL